MMDEKILKLAQERARRKTENMQQFILDKENIPKARTITEVSVERLQEREMEKGAPLTGYPELDRIIRGFLPGHLYTMTGNENVGKTSMACNMAVRVARQGKHVLYVALEPDNMVVDYIASVRTDKKFTDLTDADIQVDDGNIHVYGKDAVPNLDTLVKIIQMSERYDFIIIDHVGYFLSANSNWIQDQSSAVKRLAGLCKKKRTAIMMIAHLRKRNQSQKKNYIPTSDDISGSGAFKQDSTEVMIVVRNLIDPDAGGLEYSNFGTLYVTKTKCGPNGSMQIHFSEQKANIVSVGELMIKYGKDGWQQVRQIPIRHDKNNAQPVIEVKPEPEDDFKW